MGMDSNRNPISSHPILAFFHRAKTLFWILFWIAVPLVAISLLVVSYHRRWRTKDKDEIKYWRDEGMIGWTMLYICSFVYIFIGQDVLLYPFENRDAIFHGIQVAFGIPAAILFQIIGRGHDLDICDITSFMMVLVVMMFYFVKVDVLKVNGYHDANWDWEPPARINKKRREQFEKEEAPFRALSRQMQELERNHPKNVDGWKEMSRAKQGLLTDEWEAEVAQLRAEMDRCPRAASARSSKSK